MQQFVPLTDSDKKGLGLVDYLVGLLGAGEASDKTLSEQVAREAPALLKASKWSELLKLLVDSSAVVWKFSSPKEIESCYTLLVTSIQAHTKANEEQAGLVRSVVAAVVAGQSEKSVYAVKMKLLTQVFNYFASEQRSTLQAMLKLSAERNDDSVALRTLEQASEWCSKRWKCSAKERFELFVLYSQALARNGPKSLRALVLALSGDAEGDEVDSAARDAIALAISLPHVYLFDDLLALAPVAGLKQKAAHAGAHALLSVLVEGTVTDFERVQKEHPELLSSLKLELKTVRDKVLLLTLVSACADKTSIGYEEGAKVLGVASGKEFARWAIRAISESLVEGRLDELRQQLNVSNTVRRTIQASDWAQLQEDLARFLKGVQDTRATHKPLAAH